MSGPVPPELSEKLISLAQKYESADFLEKDPSKFMHRYDDRREAETAAFIAANLAFGRREQILSHVELILNECGKSPAAWILSGRYEDFFPESDKSFYRMYTSLDMRLFFDGLRSILENSLTIGDFFRGKWEEGKSSSSEIFLHHVIAGSFHAECALLPRSKDSAAKKVNMLLRWMVRDNSPVDMGFWSWFDKKDLLMPLDTHVMRQSAGLGLIRSKSANLRTAIALTKKVAEIFPGDPLRADFALFGLGVNS